LTAVDAREVTRRALILEDSTLTILNHQFNLATQKVYVVAIGKAALSMATAVSERLQNQITEGVITAAFGRRHQVIFPSAAFPDPRRWKSFSGGHPLPNNQSILAGWQTFQLLKRANDDRALVIFLVSGGGSAMIEWPRDDRITLEDLREANRILITSGATISEINAVRRRFSAVKGGGLSAAAPDTDQITLIVSDTNEGDYATVASGPSLEPASDNPSAVDVLNRYDLLAKLPPSIVEAEKTEDRVTSSVQGIRAHQVLLNNNTALEAAARRAAELGYSVEIAKDIVEQPIAEGCEELIARIQQMKETREGQPVCLLSGGEFACTVRGKGVGGRNLETVLRCAMKISQSGMAHVVVLSAGTDGIDGNSPAAGAVADETSIARAKELGLDPQEFLDESDSFRFFQLLDSTIMTDITGTNVRDVRILLAN
jgi:hydroxypyruvate reductase